MFARTPTQCLNVCREAGVTLHSTAGTLLHDQLVRRLTIMLSGRVHVTRPDILDARKLHVLSSGASHFSTRLLTCAVCPCKNRVSNSLWARSIHRSAVHHHEKRTTLSLFLAFTRISGVLQCKIHPHTHAHLADIISAEDRFVASRKLAWSSLRCRILFPCPPSIGYISALSMTCGCVTAWLSQS